MLPFTCKLMSSCHNVKPTVSKTRVFSLSEELKEAKKGSILLLLPSVAHERLQVLKFPNGYLLPVREIDCNKVPRVALRCTHISIPRWAIILLVASVPGDGDPTGMFNQFQLILQNSSNLLLLINSNAIETSAKARSQRKASEQGA